MPTSVARLLPGWIRSSDLDAAVADAYGWGEDWRAGSMDEDDILARLFALNQQRAT